MPPSKIARRLEKLLVVVPYVVRHPGSKLEDLSRLFDVDEEDLAADLNLLFVTGLPPYGPGDLVEVEMEQGRVWISMADYFARPVRLTPTEALTLYLKGMALLGSEGLAEADALRSALEKLRTHLDLGKLEVEVREASGGQAATLETVRRAVEASERVEIDHYSAARDEVVTRRVDPEHVFSTLGNWYVVAWDHVADAERMFRVDRMRGIRPTGERFEPRDLVGQGRPMYSPGAADIRVRLRLGPGARWVAEYYEVEEEREADGLLEIVLPTKDLSWVAKLLLRLGGEAEVLDPPELVEAAGRALEATLGRYR